ncbi:MAG: NAD(P)-dependent alcohol dehydrogenase [Pseudomonadota bacterium]
MQALTGYQYGGPKQLRLENVDEPKPEKGQLLVRVLACGMNLSDWETLTGRPLYARIEGLIRPRQPIPGSDVVGEIISLGPNVENWSVGQRVWADVVMHGKGGFAEKAVLPVDRLAALPKGLDAITAAALPQSGSIALAATKGLQKDQRVLVNGAGGGSGTLILQLARHAGAYVVAVDSAKKAPMMKRLGANQTIDSGKTDFTQTGQTWDHIIDLVASRPVWRVRRCLSADGKYVVFGGRVSAMLSALILPHCCVGAAEGTPAILDQLGRIAIDGGLKPELTSICLSEAISGLAAIGERKIQGKLVVVPTAQL